MAWIITNKDEPELAWSNSWGWGENDFDTFSDEERQTLSLPIGGEWVAVSWRKEGEANA